MTLNFHLHFFFRVELCNLTKMGKAFHLVEKNILPLHQIIERSLVLFHIWCMKLILPGWLFFCSAKIHESWKHRNKRTFGTQHKAGRTKYILKRRMRLKNGWRQEIQRSKVERIIHLNSATIQENYEKRKKKIKNESIWRTGQRGRKNNEIEKVKQKEETS